MKKSICILLLVLPFIAFQSCKEENKKVQGVIVDDTLNSKLLKREIPYKIYLPEAYNDTTKYFPIVYLLHGHGGDEKIGLLKMKGTSVFIWIHSYITNSSHLSSLLQ